MTSTASLIGQTTTSTDLPQRSSNSAPATASEGSKDQAALPELDQIARRQRRDLEQDLDGDLDIN